MRTIQRDIVGAFIFSSDGYLLLGKSLRRVYQGSWIVPGGGIEQGESKVDAVKREILEEVGIDLSGADIKLFDDTLTGESQKRLRDTDEEVLVKMNFYNYRVDLLAPAEKIALNPADDFVEAKWIPANELPSLTLAPPTKTSLQKLGIL